LPQSCILAAEDERPDANHDQATGDERRRDTGRAMSENLDLVRSIYAAWERGDFSSAEWAHTEIEYVTLGTAGPPSASAKGRTEMRHTARANIAAWAQLQIAAEEYRELDSERVLVLDDVTGRGKRSGLEVGEFAGGAHLFHVRDGVVIRLVVYEGRDRALDDLGLKE
jgi:ketosteroid isomerase-like protein